MNTITQTDKTTTATPSGKLSGKLSTFDVVFAVLAFNGPLGNFAGYLPVILGACATLGGPVIFFGCGAALLIFTVGFTTMGRHLKNPGGFYAYIVAGLGKPLGLGASFLALLSYLGILIGVYVYGGISVATFITDTLGGPAISPWMLGIALAVIVGILGYFEISLSAKLLTSLLLVEIVVIVAFDIMAFATGGAEGNTLAPLSPVGILSGNFGLALLFGFLVFAGFEATAIFREEAVVPEKTIPRATYIAVLTLGIMYGISAWALIVAVGPSKVIAATAADPVGTSIIAIGSVLGKTVQEVMTVLLITSIFAALLSIHNVAARYTYSLSVDRILPAALGRVHPKHQSPHAASIATSAFSVLCVVVGMATQVDTTAFYVALAGIGGYGMLILMLLASVAVITYFGRNRHLETGLWKTRFAPALAIAAFLIALVLGTLNFSVLIGGSEGLAMLLLVLIYAVVIAGVVMALVYKRTRPQVYARIGREEE